MVGERTMIVIKATDGNYKWHLVRANGKTYCGRRGVGKGLLIKTRGQAEMVNCKSCRRIAKHIYGYGDNNE